MSKRSKLEISFTRFKIFMVIMGIIGFGLLGEMFNFSSDVKAVGLFIGCVMLFGSGR